MAKANYTKYVILGMLSTGPMTGYEIRKYVKELFSYVWDISYGQIYPMLSRLAREGLATMSVESSARGPERKVYEITARGKEDLQKWLVGPETKEYELLLKMCFGSQMDPRLIVEKLDAYRRKRDEEIDLMVRFLEEFGDGQAYGRNAPYYRMITELGLAYFREEKAWCSKSIDMLKDKKGV
jgi:DNA-binding PadR family transcriptional regulator